mgnify:FL=1
MNSYRDQDAPRVEAYAREQAYQQWMHKLEARIGARTGLSYLDLPDYAYRDAFEDGRTPSAVARAVIRAAKSEGYE